LFNGRKILFESESGETGPELVIDLEILSVTMEIAQ
jgi:hypothetical protein